MSKDLVPGVVRAVPSQLRHPTGSNRFPAAEPPAGVRSRRSQPRSTKIITWSIAVVRFRLLSPPPHLGQYARADSDRDPTRVCRYGEDIRAPTGHDQSNYVKEATAGRKRAYRFWQSKRARCASGGHQRQHVGYPGSRTKTAPTSQIAEEQVSRKSEQARLTALIGGLKTRGIRAPGPDREPERSSAGFEGDRRIRD